MIQKFLPTFLIAALIAAIAQSETSFATNAFLRITTSFGIACYLFSQYVTSRLRKSNARCVTGRIESEHILAAGISVILYGYGLFSLMIGASTVSTPFATFALAGLFLLAFIDVLRCVFTRRKAS